MKNKLCGIYCIENIVNHKKYIGQSVDIKTRFRNHKSELRHNKHKNEHLQSSWNTYGEDSFIFYVLEYCELASLDDLETYYIEKYNARDKSYGYNYESGGHKNKSLSHETRKKIGNAHRGTQLTDEWKQHIAESNIGRVFSDETRKKISERLTGIHRPSGENHHGIRPVYCPELNEEFWGAKEVEDKYGIPASYISACINGMQKSAGKHPITGEKLHWFDIADKENINITIQN